MAVHEATTPHQGGERARALAHTTIFSSHVTAPCTLDGAARLANEMARVHRALDLFTATGSPAVRARCEEAIETLVAALDALDGDLDLENGSDEEPSLGSHIAYSSHGTDWRSPTHADEAEVDDEGDDLDRGEWDTADAEPSLCGISAERFGAFCSAHNSHGTDTEEGAR